MMQLSGNFWDYFIVYWAGVVVSFTPCVYPVMPITAGFIGGINTKGSKLMGFLLSVIYVFGIAITYCAIGIFAALSGKVFGQVQNNPYIYLVVGNILLLFALMMFDVIPLPMVGLNLTQKIKKKNIGTVVLFGIAAGLVIGPCTAPILGTLLLYVASKQNIAHAVSLLFVFSYGIGTSLILVGTFSGILANLPKSGKWLTRVKQLSGLVMLGIAEFFLIKAGTLWF
ncbi:Cytochrome c-type biogenesis protein DsbD, protein-disulfide reductase [hydrothermal vent metagenome]|uniref:Cytochrome c-type biogenesis protein DsbD, protein-disulfide reductase n=1 Tax=hydrothermal vent metagenome TaxID=652676 RepID=A0A3B0T4S8_9ZZZZ